MLNLKVSVQRVMGDKHRYGSALRPGIPKLNPAEFRSILDLKEERYYDRKDFRNTCKDPQKTYLRLCVVARTIKNGSSSGFPSFPCSKDPHKNNRLF